MKSSCESLAGPGVPVCVARLQGAPAGIGPPSEEPSLTSHGFSGSAWGPLSFFKVHLYPDVFLGSAFGRARREAIPAKNCRAELGDTEAGGQKYPPGRREERTGNQPPETQMVPCRARGSRPGPAKPALNT